MISFLLLFLSCETSQDSQNDVLKYVNPLIGTGGHGHTYPGATSPFGMVQLSPDTRLDGWDGCSGYHYTDSIIYGFSHTHLSGTGVSDYGDVLLMPITGKAIYKNTEYASLFSHKNELSQAGYYSVKLDKFGILAELTTSSRTGMHRYSFAQSENNKVILDLRHRDIVLDSYLEQVDDSTLKGYRISKAWAQEQHIYFYIQFSQKINLLEMVSNDSIIHSKKIKSESIVASVQFDQLKDKEILVKVGISAVDMNGAKKNLELENLNWNFDAFKNKNLDAWRKELNRIEISDNNESRKTIFYTALYHNLIVPNLFSDIDGRYRGMDMKIHRSKNDQYTIFSLWDTYRATHPLYTLIETKRTSDFISTFKNQFDDGGLLPIWELAGNYTGCMIGYHSIPVIADAYLKGLTDIPGDTLLTMMLTSANQKKLGLEAYKKNGFISVGDDAESVSKTLEYAYDDWCIAQVAQKVGRDSIYRQFIKRAQSYKNLLDPSIGYMRPKLNQIWKEPFEPSEVDFNYTEANSWQYSFYVPQDIYSFIDLLGSKERFENQLDNLFTTSSQTTGREQSDISGLIGQYAHGNEPSHHMAYLYDYVNKSQKTQNYVSRIVNELYSDKPDGLCGNEDCGQMSAWYVFSTLGFYPVNPASGEYVFGKPFFDKVELNLENGKTFTIEKQGDKSENALVNKILLNGKEYNKAYLKHSDIVKGGTLTFVMDQKKAIVFTDADLPNSKITDDIIIPVPAIRSAKRVFRDSTIINMEAVEGAKIFYSLNGGEEIEYQKPFVIREITKLLFRAEKNDISSKTVSSEFYKIPKGRQISIKNKWSPQYSAGGNDALIDGLLGKNNFRNGSWQGYYYEDFEAVLELGKEEYLTKISMNFIQDARSWIWMPEYVEYWGSTDGKYFFSLGKIKNTVSKQDYDVIIRNFAISFYPKKIRYFKIYAKNHNICPKEHLGAGNKAYIFADEIIVE